LRNDSSKIISLILTFMWYMIGVYILLIGNVDAIILRNEDCLDAFRLRRRHGLFSFTSGLPRVKGKNNSQRVTKAHLDSPRVTSCEATSDEWGIQMGLE
jgi:hypothetical protein